MSLRREVHRAVAVLEQGDRLRGFEEFASRAEKAIKILKAGLAGGHWINPDEIQRPSISVSAGGGSAEESGKGAANKDAKRARWKRADKRSAEREEQK